MGGFWFVLCNVLLKNLKVFKADEKMMISG